MHANATQTLDDMLYEQEVASKLAISVRTLQAWRAKGKGPKFTKLGRAIRYSYRHVVEWIDANTRVTTGPTPNPRPKTS